MKLSELGEFGLIERIRRSSAKKDFQAPIGIGDDAAALLCSPGSALLATTDMLIEGVHFDLATTDMGSLGWKSAAVNVSDIAAMGGNPRFGLVALGLPQRTTVEQVEEFYRGFGRLAGRHGMQLVGGDTCGSRSGLIISVTVLGEAKRKEIVARSGARPGDLVFVTAKLGDSAAGREFLKSGSGGRAQGSRGRSLGPKSQETGVRKLIEKHLRPEPRVAWGRKLAASGCASAMIDVSDGLSSDLGHICDESGVGAEIAEERIPLSKELRSAKGLRLPALAYALSGGEDYELLFTLPPAKRKKLRSLRIPVAEIGVITKGPERVLIDAQGRRTPLIPSGYDHFAGARAGKRRKR